MDLSLYLRVLWRFWFVVALGLLLATSLAFLSFVKVNFDNGGPHFAYRLPETWASTETILITAKGTPWARLSGSLPTEGLAARSAFYSALANSEPVQKRLAASGPVRGTMIAQPAVDQITTIRAPLPFVSIVGTAERASDAVSIARRGGAALLGYVSATQNSAGIPPAQRVRLSILTQARPAKLLTGRKKTLPIVIFMTIMIATIGLAFILENLRPRVQMVDRGQAQGDVADRQTA